MRVGIRNMKNSNVKMGQERNAPRWKDGRERRSMVAKVHEVGLLVESFDT